MVLGLSCLPTSHVMCISRVTRDARHKAHVICVSRDLRVTWFVCHVVCVSRESTEYNDKVQGHVSINHMHMFNSAN